MSTTSRSRLSATVCLKTTGTQSCLKAESVDISNGVVARCRILFEVQRDGGGVRCGII